MKKQKYFFNPYTGELLQSKPLNLKFYAVRYFKRDCSNYCAITWKDIKKVYR